jgi:hypothetical protein
MIKNTDGTPYGVAGTLGMFDPGNNEFNLLNQWDQDIIRIGGSPIFYYEVLIQPQTVHKLYMEDRGKLWSPQGVQLWGLYEPKANLNTLGLFGIDAPDEMIFEFNYREVLQLIGHAPKIGSRLFSPHKSENWVVIQKNDDEFKMWGQMRLQLICQKFQESTTDNSKTINQPQTDFKLN